ncbi:MAG: glycosyltransferase family 39 protein [Deltaproteobacteria bacterium]|nr:glycosyltransferase family 39 protein [Deltaproteobacteria bacterium]
MARRKSKRRSSKPAKHEKEARTTKTTVPVPRPRLYLGFWAGALGIVSIFFLVLKMFTMNTYAGDEHIYLYQAKLISQGVAPYSGFAMAHPPVHALFTALTFKVFGYHFLLGRFLPVLWCLTGGIVLAFLVRREYGRVASVATVALYLLAYEPLRASSHFTGVNMTVALLISAVFAYRLNAIRAAAVLSTLAVFTRLYAAPGILVLVVFALVADRRSGLRLVFWGAVTGTVCFILIGIWTGFQDMIHNMVLYHAQKTPMKPGSLVGMRDKVLFHNASLAAVFLLAQVAAIATLASELAGTGRGAGPLSRLAEAMRSSRLGLFVLASSIAFFFQVVLLSMDRVWMYYFIPSFPFAAVAGGWLVARWVQGVAMLIRGKLEKPHRMRFVCGVILFIAFIMSYALSPMLERNLKYYKLEMKKPQKERAHTYAWNPGLLPGGVNEAVKSILWKDVRVIGEPHTRFNYYLWHESRVLDIVDEVVETIKNKSGASGEIFGDSGTVPLIALLSDRRIAGNEVDTNIQRYRSGNANPKELVKRIDNPKTQMIILRHNFGVFGVAEVRRLVKEKYRRLKSVRSAQGRVFHLYKRLDAGERSSG